MRGQKLITLSDFRGGLRLDHGSELRTDLERLGKGNFLRNLQNVEPLDHGGLRKRPGCLTYGAASGSADKGGRLWYFDAEENEDSYAFAGPSGTPTVMYPFNMGTFAWAAACTGSLAGSTYGIYAMIRAPVSGGQGPIYAIGPDRVLQKNANTGNFANWTAAAGTLPTQRTRMVYHQNRVWIAGVGSAPAARPAADTWATVYASSLGDPRDWSSTAPSDSFSVDINPEDGEPVVELVPFSSQLLVFKRTSLWTIYDLNLGSNRLVARGVEVVPNSVVSTPYGVVFAAFVRYAGDQAQVGVDLTYRRCKLFVTDGQQVRPLGPPDALGEGVTTGNWTSSPSVSGVPVFLHDRLYWPVGFVNDQDAAANYRAILMYDFRSNSYWKHIVAGNPQWLFAGRNAFDDMEYALFSSRNNNQIVRLFAPHAEADYGAAFTWDAYLPWLDLGNPHLLKRIREIRTDGQGDVDVTMYDRPGGTATLLDAVEGDVPNNDENERRFYTPGGARLLGLKIGKVGNTGDAALHNITVAYDLRAD